MAKYYCYQIYPKAKTNSELQEIPITLLTTLLFHTTENKTHLYREMPLCFSCGTKGKKAVFNARLTFHNLKANLRGSQETCMYNIVLLIVENLHVAK